MRDLTAHIADPQAPEMRAVRYRTSHLTTRVSGTSNREIGFKSRISNTFEGLCASGCEKLDVAEKWCACVGMLMHVQIGSTQIPSGQGKQPKPASYIMQEGIEKR